MGDESDPVESRWRRYRSGDVEFVAPEGLAESRQGIDSSAAEYGSHGITVTVDSGPFSDSLTRYESQPGYEHRRELIDGRAAKIVSFNGPEGAKTVAARIEGDVSQAPLTVVVHSSSDVPLEEGLKIVRSAKTVRS